MAYAPEVEKACEVKYTSPDLIYAYKEIEEYISDYAKKIICEV